MKTLLSNSYANVEQLPFELVERKGVGHPDTMCDAIAEKASQYYSQYCMEHFGRVAHHWFDKVMLIGGEAEVDFGKGEIIRPYNIIFAGKGARSFGDHVIPLHDIFFQASADVLSKVLTGFDAEKHIVITDQIINHHGAGRKNSRYRPVIIEDLVDIKQKNRVSNDCNLLSSYAPLSRLEKFVMLSENYINGEEFKSKNPDTGWDVKVFGSRRGDTFNLIINIPFLGKYIKSEQHYYQRKKEITKDIEEYLYSEMKIHPEILINPQDRNNKVYLTALGSVADTGDIGVVGRGNRINGLITPMRSMSIEAPAGKNPTDHTGKLYGVLALQLSQEIYELTKKSNEVHIFTSKEAPLNDPDEIIVRIEGCNEDDSYHEVIMDLVHKRINQVENITSELIFEGITMW